MTRSVLYASSPLLASKTPVWRSKFVMAVIALGFITLVGRALWIQVIGNEFFQRQGEVRFARTLELPANRGRVLDRNGLLLATSVPTPSVWAIPEDVNATPEQMARLARLLEMPLADLKKRLADEERTFVWLKRHVDDAVWQQIAEMKIPGIYERREYKRKYPEERLPRMWWASPMSRTSARRAWSCSSTRNWLAVLVRVGSSRTGWAVWSRTWASACRR